MKNNKLFLIAINTIPNPVVITNGKELLIANDNFLSFFNYENLEDFVKHNGCVCNLFIQSDECFSLDKIDKNTLWTDHLFNCNRTPIIVSILDKDNNPKIFEVGINKLEEDNNQYIVVFTDVTPIHKEKELLEKMAYTDHLTKIYNRQMFDQLYLKELENKKRYGDTLSLVMLDIDHFKNINDTYGHDIGDKILVALTQLISKHLRTNDIFARWGGEEFLILMPRTDKAIAYEKAQELREIIQDHQDQIPQFTVSFGVTQILDSDKGLSAFIRVDKALYEAKVKRNNVIQL